MKNNLKTLQPTSRDSTYQCMICTKSITFGPWNQVCLTCCRYACRECIDAQRVVHRHALNWVQARKVVMTTLVMTGGKVCAMCRLPFAGARYERIECMGCKAVSCCVQSCAKNKRMPVNHAICGGAPSNWQLLLKG